MPAAAEICQSCFGWKEGRHLGLLFFVNTGGAVVGALACGLFLLPALGQIQTMLLAAFMNVCSAVLILSVKQNVPVTKGSHEQAEPDSSTPSASSMLELAGFALGLLSLAYEM